MKLLSVQRVSKFFSGLRALSHVSFGVEQGETLGIMGANGAGKTTLFATIAGHLTPSDGQIQFRGRSIVGLRPHQICQLGIARTFQIVRPFASMSVLENVETAVLFGGGRDVTQHLADQAYDFVETVGLGPQCAKPAGQLTLSDRKRLEVARALATSPELLLLDEVMAGLTPSEVSEMMEVLTRVRVERELTIVIVEHVVRAMVELSRRIIVLHHGELIAEGTPQEVASDEAVLSAYFGKDRK